MTKKYKFLHYIKNRSGGDLIQEQEILKMPYTAFLVHCSYWNDVQLLANNRKT